MSIEEDIELRDMITQCLDTNGCLPKIKAQLRASMFLLLHEDNKLSSLQPLMNKKLKELMETPEGKLMFYVVYEFLQFCGLDCTLSVYECESCTGQDYNYEGGQKLREELHISNTSTPVLLEIIKSFLSKSESEVKTNGFCPVEESNKTATEAQLNSTFNVNSPQIITNGNGGGGGGGGVSETHNIKLDNAVTDNGNNSHEETYSSIEEESFSKSKSENSSKSLKLTPPQKSEKKSKTSSFSPLPDFSPLQHNKSRVTDILPSLYNKEFKDKSNPSELEKMFDMETEYEEDFICSGDDLSLKSYVKTDISKSENESVNDSEKDSVQKDIPEKVKVADNNDGREKVDDEGKSESIDENISNKSETEL